MSRPTADPLETLVADGRIGFRPATQFGAINVIGLRLDLHQLRDNLYIWLVPILSLHQPHRNQYLTNRSAVISEEITEGIRSDVQALLHIAICICYNRLLDISEIWNFAGYTSRMTPAFVNNKTEMPTFLASLLGSIGPLRVHESIVDEIFVYVPTSTIENDIFGRGNVARLLKAMRNCNIGLSAIDFNYVTQVARGFTTIRHIVDAGKWDTYGTVHPSNYDNEDVVRSYLFASSALGSVPVALPGVGSTVNTHENQPSLVSLVGRGDNPLFFSILARGVSISEIRSMIYYRIVAP